MLLGGCGVPSYLWDPTVAMLPAERTVVRLDRPGLAGTPWPGRLPALAEEVQTLIALLESVAADGLGGPAVVVGHSMAGLHAEALVRVRPDLVAGLVLADGSVGLEAKPPGRHRVALAAARGLRTALRLAPALGSVGPLVHRVQISAASGRRLTQPLPPEARAGFGSPHALPSVLAEGAAFDAQVFDLDRLRIHAWPGVPTVVLTAGAGDRSGEWAGGHRRLAERLDAVHLIADDARHLIMLDRPDLVVAAIVNVGGQR